MSLQVARVNQDDGDGATIKRNKTSLELLIIAAKQFPTSGVWV